MDTNVLRKRMSVLMMFVRLEGGPSQTSYPPSLFKLSWGVGVKTCESVGLTRDACAEIHV